MHTNGWMHTKVTHILNHGANVVEFPFFGHL